MCVKANTQHPTHASVLFCALIYLVADDGRRQSQLMNNKLLRRQQRLDWVNHPARLF
jgi:hypothetical protein